MKLNVLDAHDRLKHLKKQDFSIGECCQDLINQRPFGEYPFYIFAHARTDDDGVSKRLIWQPRLTKPEAQSNSMLFKAYPGSEEIKVIWILPAEELWAQYEKGLVTENETVVESIYNFRYHKKKMEAREPDDLEDYRVKDIYSEIARNSKFKKKIIQ
jgi:hypothetical protein